MFVLMFRRCACVCAYVWGWKEDAAARIHEQWLVMAGFSLYEGVGVGAGGPEGSRCSRFGRNESRGPGSHFMKALVWEPAGGGRDAASLQISKEFDAGAFISLEDKSHPQAEIRQTQHCIWLYHSPAACAFGSLYTCACPRHSSRSLQFLQTRSSC